MKELNVGDSGDRDDGSGGGGGGDRIVGDDIGEYHTCDIERYGNCISADAIYIPSFTISWF
jgi:hypothetical protein